MKVLFIGIHGYDFAYTRVRCYNFAKLLRERGIAAEVLTFQEAFSPSVKDDGMLRLGDGEKLIRTGQAFARLLRERGTILYTQKAHWHAAAPFLLRRLGLNRFILDYDDWDLDRSPFFNRGYLNRLFFGAAGMKQVTAALAARADACVTSTSPLYELMSSYNQATFLVPTGVDAERFRRKGPPPEGGITVVWNGKVWGRVVYENVRFCIDCFTEVRRVHNTIRLVIAGDGDWMGKLRDYVGERGIGGVEFPGWINPDRMPEFLACAHIGLLPLIPDAENADWMRCKSPTKFFEYMAMELPTVASRYGEVESIVTDGREAFLASDRGEFTDKLRRLVEDESLRREMAERARARVEERYCHKVMGDSLVKVIEYVTRGGHRGR